MIGLEAYARDAGIPARAGDSALTPPDPAALCELVRELLCARGDLRPTAATWTFARWKPGISLTTAWEVEFEGGASRVVCLKQYAGGKAADLVDRLEARGEDEAGLRPHALDVERGLHLWAFPYDRLLPGLERALEMRRTRRMIDDSGVFAPLLMRPGPSEITPLRYKPERRAVLRLDLRLRPADGGPRTKERVALRVLPPEEASRIAAARRDCEDAGGAELLPRLLHAEERTGTLVEEWLAGTPRERRDFSHAVEAGRALARLHALPIRAQATARGGDGDGDSALFRWDATLAGLAVDDYACAPTRVAWTHGDFHPEQLLESAGTWRFLDLDCLGPGDPLSDLATWIADEVTEPDGRSFEHASADLLAGYGSVDVSELAQRVAREVRSRAAGALRRLQAGAPEIAELWLELARDIAPKRTVNGWSAALAFAGSRVAPLEPTESVERVEVDRERKLIVTVRTPEGLRWFERASGTDRELFPFDDPKLPLVRAEPFHPEDVLSWRAGRRVVLRVPEGFAKGWKRSRFDAATLRHERALETCREDGFRVAGLASRDASLASVVFEPLAGTPLLAHLDEPRVLAAVGRALDRFRRGDVGGLPLHGPQEELDLLVDLATRVAAVRGPVPADWRETRKVLEAFVPDAVEPVVTHRDLHDGQLLVDGETLGLLDFDLLCAADLHLDPANLCAHLELRRMQDPERFSPECIAAARDAFLGALGIDASEHRYAFYEAATFLRLSLLYSLRPRWVSLAGPLVRHAQQALSRRKR